MEISNQAQDILNRRGTLYSKRIVEVSYRDFEFDEVYNLNGFNFPIIHVNILNDWLGNKFDIYNTEYWKDRQSKKLNMDKVKIRIKKFFNLYKDMEENGWRDGSRVIIFKTIINEESYYHRVDGSHRTACAFLLDIPISCEIYTLEDK